MDDQAVTCETQLIPDIVITEQEELIFSRLREIFAFISAKYKPGTEASLRVVGGWVRDKVRGSHPNDIDVVYFLDGVDLNKAHKAIKAQNFPFIQSLNFVVKNNREGNLVIGINDVTIDIVSINSSFSMDTQLTAHFELQCQHLTDKDQKYAYIDSHLRDLTINSMYYNIRTRQIEDWTKLGVLDVLNRKLRAPIEDYRLWGVILIRISRVFRFSSTLGYEIEESIIKALKSKETHNYLKGAFLLSTQTEIQKMFGGKYISKAIVEFVESGLQEVIFSGTSSSKSVWTPELSNQASKAVQCLDVFLTDQAVEYHLSFDYLQKFVPLSRYILFLTVFLLPVVLDSHPYTRNHLVKALSLPHQVVTQIWENFQSCKELHRMVVNFSLSKTINVAESSMFLRKHKQAWLFSFYSLKVMYFCDIIAVPSEDTSYFIALFDLVREWKAHDLIGGQLQVWDIIPVVNAHDVMEKLGVDPGPRIKTLLEAAMIMQFEKPDCTKEDCLEHLKSLM